jgi:hypothetical protein
MSPEGLRCIAKLFEYFSTSVGPSGEPRARGVQLETAETSSWISPSSLPLLVGINHKEVAQHEARMRKSSSLTFTMWGPQFVNGKNIEM